MISAKSFAPVVLAIMTFLFIALIEASRSHSLRTLTGEWKQRSYCKRLVRVTLTRRPAAIYSIGHNRRVNSPMISRMHPVLASVVLGLGLSNHAVAQGTPGTYPAKSIRIIVPFTPGGPAD